MYYYYNALQTKSGDILPDYLVRLLDASGNEVDIFADNSGTPIVSVSGVANAAKADALGMVRFWVPNGTYDIAIYDTTDTFKGREEGVPMMDAGGVYTDLSEDTGASLVGSTGGITVQASLNARPTSAALAATGGAAAVGTTNSDVQTDINSLYETAASLLDLSTVISVTTATALDTDDLNKTIIVSGTSSFTLNLPVAGAVGQALKLYCARGYTGVLTIQSSVSSPCNVDGTSELDFMAGESGTFVFDGSDWIVLDRTFVPIIAQMITAASDFAVGTAWNELPMSVAGTQMMRNDVKARWNYSSGFFQAPRDGVYAISTMLWAQHTDGGGAGFYDVGAYASLTPTGTPSGRNFKRIIVGNLGAAAFESLPYSDMLFMNKGENLYLSIEASATLTSPKIVSSGTLESALNIVEVRV